MDKPELWFSDCEVYAYDLIWVFKSNKTGEVVWFHNDVDAVMDFIAEHPNIWLVGYNFRDYDQYILKGTLMGFTNRQLKELNDILIYDSFRDAWDYLGSESWEVEVPPIIDLFHDIVPRKSLKEIEGNIGMDVEETNVSFDIDRPLTEEELQGAVHYCIHDVEATERLYRLRYDYIRTKKTLCEMADLSDAEMMKNTNARVVSEALHAVHCDPINTFGKEYYIDRLPDDIIDFDRLPEIVQDFVSGINTFSGWKEELEPILFDLYGTPTIMGVGGLHASTGSIVPHMFKSGPRKGTIEHRYVARPDHFVSGNGRTVLIQDIGSFYPSMMIIFNFLSRGIPPEWVHLFTDFYDLRMSSKKHIRECEAKGDTKGAAYWKSQADAAKLVLNTVYGCLKNQYNKLYDPFMGTCVCITGQLLIIDLMNRIHDRVPDMEIVQLNTDGWVLSVPDEDVPVLDEVIEDWKELTGFTVDTDIIKQLWQRDVNNYVMEFDTGKVKAKGGTVKNWRGGDFKSNTATIIDEAIVKNLLYNISVEETVKKCNDLERFQVILKAGSGYTETGRVPWREYNYAPQRVVQKEGQKDYEIIPKTKYQTKNFHEYESINGKVHRVYATRGKGFTFFKRKGEGNPAIFPSSPVCALEDFNLKSIDEIDKYWYYREAIEKLKAFTGQDQQEVFQPRW